MNIHFDCLLMNMKTTLSENFILKYIEKFEEAYICLVDRFARTRENSTNMHGSVKDTWYWFHDVNCKYINIIKEIRPSQFKCPNCSYGYIYIFDTCCKCKGLGKLNWIDNLDH